jgi:hypothetical protein
MVTVGATIFWVIVLFAVAVQPFAPVTVTVYTPGLVIFNVADVPRIVVPLDHEYVPPPLAVKVILVVAHVSILVFGFVLIAAVGF